MTLERWTFDTVHSAVGFSVRHMMVARIRGTFGSWTGSLYFDEANPSASRVEAEIDSASVETRDAQRDAHLRSSDFLAVEQHPRIVFRSTRVDGAGDGPWKVHGELTIRGVTRPVVLDVQYGGRVKDPWGNDRGGFSATTAINRRDFGLVWNQVLEAGGIALGDEVAIQIDVQVVRDTAR